MVGTFSTLYRFILTTQFLVSQKVSNSQDAEYMIKLTYAELYNEELKDLLSPTPNENLKIIDDPNLGPLIQNITEVHFTSGADVKRRATTACSASALCIICILSIIELILFIFSSGFWKRGRTGGILESQI